MVFYQRNGFCLSFSTQITYITARRKFLLAPGRVGGEGSPRHHFLVTGRCRLLWALAWGGNARWASPGKSHSDGVLRVRQKNVIFSEECISRFCPHASDRETRNTSPIHSKPPYSHKLIQLSIPQHSLAIISWDIVLSTKPGRNILMESLSAIL
jgi:hypothetical protein